MPTQAEGHDCGVPFSGSPWWDGRGDEASKGEWSQSKEQASAEEDWAFFDNLNGVSYIDAHCHLDSCVLNEKYGDEIWTMKKWLCYRWLAGNCWYGDDCEFAHGEDALVRMPPLQVKDLELLVQRHPHRQQRAGPHLGWLITNCCEGDAIADTLTLVEAGERFLGGRVLCTFGVHPHMYEEYSDALEAELLRAVERCGPKAVAWGECGLDYYKNHYDAQDKANRSRMVEVFARQARLAAAKKLPLVVHSRDAEDDTMAVLTTWLPREHPLHLHAFQGSSEMVHELLRLLPNAVVGISGAIFVVRAVKRVAEALPLDRLVLETDAPYLSNEPREIPKIARAVARIKGVSAREVLLASNKNSERVYRLSAA